MVKQRSGPVAPEQDAFLAIQRAADALMSDLGEVLKPAEVSPTQYNVLRILRGAEAGCEAGLACGEIAGRMITREPDMTRLLDRLERRGLIARSRSTEDRRVVRARITPAGLKLLAGLDGPVRDAHGRQFAHVPAAKLRQLTKLLSDVRGGNK